MVLIDSEHQIVSAVEPEPPRSRSRALGVAGLQGLVAVVLILAGTMGPARDLPMWFRVAAVAGGLILAFKAIHGVATALRGRPVDTAFGLAIVWLGTLAMGALLVPWLPVGEASDSGKTLDVPALQRPDLFSAHPLGTNALGLDLLGRVLWGARQSLTTAAIAIILATIIGGMIGLIAGSWGGWADRAARVGTNVGLAFPPLVLLLVLGAIAGHSTLGIAFALGVLSVASLARISRAETVRYASREHAYVAKVLGGTRWQVLRREVLPPVGMALVSLAFLTIPLLIVAEAALGYLGLGVRPPSPTWGNMLAEASNGGLEKSPHIVLVPGVVLVATVFALNLIGQRIRAKWDTG